MPFNPGYSRTKTFANAGSLMPTDINDIQDDLGSRIASLSVVLATLPGSPTSGQVVLYQTAAMVTAGHPPQFLRWNGSVWQQITGGSELLRRGLMSAYRATNTGVLNSGDLVPFDTEEFDVSGWFASSLFTPLLAGAYRISWALTELTAIGSGALASQLVKNGSMHRKGSTASLTSVSDELTTVGSAIVVANGTTDTFGIAVLSSLYGGTLASLKGGASQTYMHAELIG